MNQDQKRIITDLKGLAGVVLVSEILKKYGLIAEDVRTFFRIYQDVLERKLPLARMAEVLAQETRLDLRVSNQIVEEIRKEVLFEVLDYLQPRRPLAEVKAKIEEQKRRRERQIMQEIKRYSPSEAKEEDNFKDKVQIDSSAFRPSLKKREEKSQERDRELELNSPAKQLGL